jgi:AcrR family transcriptional regulator
VRRRPPQRFRDIAEAGREAFTARGFRLTQMADVARELGVSAGTLYNYVESKEALFHLVVQYVVDLPLPEEDGFVRTESMADTIRLVETQITSKVRWPKLAAAGGRAAPPNVRRELDDVIAEFFAMAASLRRAIWLMDRCAPDVPELGEVVLVGVRLRFFEDLHAYIARRAKEGRFDPGPSTLAVTRAIVECVAWLAMHRHRDPTPFPIDDAAALATAHHLAAGALLPRRP